MKDQVTAIVENVISEFKGDIKHAKNAYSDLVEALTSEVDAVGFDKLEDYFLDVIDKARGHVASKAANQLDSSADQQAAITQVESWFSENVSNEGSEIAVLCAIWGYSNVQAAGDIRDAIAAVQRSPSV